MLVHAAANMDPFGPLWDKQNLRTALRRTHSYACPSNGPENSVDKVDSLRDTPLIAGYR
jgi:hypothetical protein